MADDVFTSPHYEHLESALARHEAAGHLAAVALTALAPRFTLGEDQPDPAAQLADMLDQATQKLRPGKRTRARVAGLIPTPAEPIADDMQTALTERQTLIEAAAGRRLDEARRAGASWASRLGKPPTQPRARTQWQAHAATIALYRYRYEIIGPSPLGDAQSVRTPEQAAEHRTAQSAFARLRQLSTRTDSSQRPSIDRVRRL